MTISLLLSLLNMAAFAESPSWKAVEQVFERKGTTQEDMLKVSFLRTDLQVNVGS